MVNQEKTYASNPLKEDCLRNNTCFTCGKPGHYSQQCPAKMGKPALQVNTLGRHPNPGYQQGRVHHISAEEARESPNVFIGMFPINGIPAVILFDSGATHTFISRSFTPLHNFPVSLLDKIMVV